MELKSQLPRMAPQWYCGPATVFWTYTMDERRTGWLTPTFHRHFRELLLHAAYRYQIAIPAYCLMPDHLHWIGMGLKDSADQRRATRFLRSRTARLLHPLKWQRQPHDHVLREKELVRQRLLSTIDYVLENPVRKGLVLRKEDWPFSGCIVPGYPHMDWTDPDYWPRFSEILLRERSGEGWSAGS